MTKSSWVKPEYEYGMDTTLGALWTLFMTANRGMISTAGLAKVFGVTELTIKKWMADKDEQDRSAVIARYAPKVEEVTGISVDRYLVIVAKRELLASHPDLREQILADTRHTRTDYLDALRSYAEKEGYLSLETQLRLTAKTNPWFAGRHLPTGDGLKTLMLGTYGVNFNPALNADDVTLIRVTRAVFRCEPVEAFPWLTSFRAMCKKFFDVYGSIQTVTDVERRTGMNRQVIARVLEFARYDDAKTYNGPLSTVYRILMAILKQEAPSVAEQMESKREEFEEKDVLKTPIKLSSPSVSLPKPAARSITPVNPESSVPPVVPMKLDANEFAALAEHYREIARRNLAIADLYDRKAGRPVSVQVSEPISPSLSVTQRTLDEQALEALAMAEPILLDLTALVAQPGERVSEVTIGRIRKMAQQLRAAIEALLPMESGARIEAYRKLGNEFDELVLALRCSKYPTHASMIEHVLKERMYKPSKENK